MKNGERSGSFGFTLIELIMVILIIAVLSAFALPRFSDLSRSAKVAVINGYKGNIEATVNTVQAIARMNEMIPLRVDPGTAAQARYLITTEAGEFEVMHNNLCPESRAELGDRLTLLDHMDFQVGAGVEVRNNNRYTVIGYDLPSDLPDTLGNGQLAGCYVAYDSFTWPDCTIRVVLSDC